MLRVDGGTHGGLQTAGITQPYCAAFKGGGKRRDRTLRERDLTH
jgi:hypothetical protein